MSRCGNSIVLLAWWLLAVLPVRAEEVATVVLVTAADSFGAKSAGLVEYLVEQNLRRVPGRRLVDVEQLLQATGPAERPQRLARARDLVSEGVQAYENLELDKAVSHLRQAERLLLDSPVDLASGGQDLLVQALTYLGASLLSAGELELGQQAFRRLLVMQPRARLDEQLFSPELRQYFSAVKQDLAASPRGALRVMTTPAHGQVYLDGVFRCVAPCRVEGVVAGSHYVVARRLGYESTGRVLEVAAGEDAQPVNLRLLDLAAGEELLRELERGAASLVREHRLGRTLCRRLSRAGVAQVVVGRVGRAPQGVAVSLVVAELPEGRIIGAASAELDPRGADFAGSVGELFTRALAGGRWERLAGLPLVPAPPAEGTGPGGEPSLLSRWWFWAVVGVVVAGAATTTALLLTRGSGPESILVLQF